MYYKYQRKQILGKRLKVPRNILKKVYNCTISFKEFIEYQLDNKIPTSCIIESDRRIVEKFGINRCKELDWDLINKRIYPNNLNIRNILMVIDSQVEDINHYLYELIKDQIKPSDYSSKMSKIYSNRLFEISQIENYDIDNYKNNKIRDLKSRFNDGRVSLKEIISNWELFKNKDLSYCLLKDENNKNNITDNLLKEFMSNYSTLVPLINKYYDIYTFINTISNISSEDEKHNYLKQFTDDILNKARIEYEQNKQNSHIYQHYKLTNNQYRELFKYSSLEKELNKIQSYNLKNVIEELKTLPEDYVFNIPIPFSILLDNDVLHFIGIYGLKNIVDFDNECGHFFTNNNCEMLKIMNDMYLHYSGNEHDSNKKFDTKENGNYIDRPYTKDEFYEAMRRMIVYGPNNSDYVDKVPDYRKITGEFRARNVELFISEQAPEELQKLFYTKSITPQLLLEHPEYIQYLNGKDLSSCFKNKEIKVEGSSALDSYENIYKFISSKTNFNGVMDFITEYSNILDIVTNRDYISEIKFSNTDDLNQIKNRILEAFRDIIIKKRLVYPKYIPKDLIKKYPSMFLDKNAPKELQEAFYNRTINSAFLLSNPSYRNYISNIDLEVIFKYMPVKVLRSSEHSHYITSYHQINFVNALKEIYGEKDALDIMYIYGKYVEQVYETNILKNFLYNPEFTQDGFLDELDKTILQNIIDGNMKYDENIPIHFKNNNPSLFLNQNIPLEIKNKFYNREFTLKDFYDNPELLDIFENTNIACAFSENMSWIIPLFNDSEDFKTANYNRMKIITAYSKIQDVELQKAFKEYVMEFGTNIDVEKIEYASEVLSRLSLSNSSEIFIFRKELAKQILNSKNPLENLNKIEDLFIKNTIPTVGKMYSCFEILHPNFQGFNFENSMVSPVLKKSSTIIKKVIVSSDLIKSSFGSNNRSVNTYLKNIEFGYSLYKSIKSGQIQLDSLGEAEIKELTTFCNHLTTLYNNTLKAKKENKTFISTGNVLNDILELSKKLSPNGSLNYNLADRVIRMFCGFTGINTLKKAKEYIEEKIKTADSRNRNAANSDMVLEKGDFIKGIRGITYLRNILQNGSVSKEYLGSSAGSDATPLDTDISMIMSSNGTISEKINATAASSYGPIWFVLKNDDRFITTRTGSETLDAKRDMSKMEVFYTGVLGQGHYGIRTGFASSEINYIVMENYNPRVGLEIAMNGFYIPVANKAGKIVFTPKDYDELRAKMNGLSYYGINQYIIDKSKEMISPEIDEIIKNMDKNNPATQIKNNLIWSDINKAVNQFGLSLKNNIDLSTESAILFNTGSTGRYTNVPGYGDFDYTMQLDRTIYKSSEKMNELRNNIIETLSHGKKISYSIIDGDIRELKTTIIDNNGVEHEVEIDITFTNKTDETEYASDVCVSDRLNSIKNSKDRKIVTANIIYAKQFLKGIGAYKPARKYPEQGGLGGIGVENWILQNGGTFYSAAKSFIEVANKSSSFEQFKNQYSLPNFGINHMAIKKGFYPHDNYIENMNEAGYQKMVKALKEYLKSMKCDSIQSNNLKR